MADKEDKKEEDKKDKEDEDIENEVRGVDNAVNEKLRITNYNPRKDDPRHINIKEDRLIWTGFPASSRFLYSICCQAKCITDLNTPKLFSEQCLETPLDRDPFCQHIIAPFLGVDPVFNPAATALSTKFSALQFNVL